jgi:cell wall-associated NlpC family hydrolase
VATPRATRYRARHARPATLPRALSVAGLATATTVALLPAGSAAAEPAPSLAQVQRTISALDSKADAAVEDFRQAEQALEEVERRSSAAAEQVAQEQARLDEVRATMGQVVAAAYRRGSTDRLASLVADSDPQTFLDRASSLDRVGRSQAEVLADVQAARHRLDKQQAAAERELAGLREAERTLVERKAGIEKALAEQKRLLAGLEAEQRQRIEAARLAAAAPAPPRASRARAEGEAPAAAAPAAPGAPAAPAATGGTYDGPASGRAKVAIEEGYRQLGKPYRYGGNGPQNFDCSGFTSWVWRAAGVSLPRTSRDQYAQGRKVARADVQPGDLLFFGSPIGHVGMYVGDGMMINSPQSGGNVRVQPAFRSDFVGAVRP